MHALHRLADEIGRRGVGFHHAAGARIDHEDRLRGDLHQQPVARFRVAEPGIFLLDRLFGRQQPLLDGGEVAHVAADRHELALAARLQQAIAHRNVGLARDLVVDLAPARRQAQLGFLDHLLDLGPALDGGDVRPGLSRPRSRNAPSWSSPEAMTLSATVPSALMTSAMSAAAENRRAASAASSRREQPGEAAGRLPFPWTGSTRF